MKTLMFKKEFASDILSGIETGTIRKHDRPRYSVGDIVSGVHGWRTRASDGFVTIRITGVRPVKYNEITDEMLRRTTATRSWYVDTHQDLKPDTPMHFYGFEVVNNA